MVIVKLWGAEVSLPPLAVPPLSCAVTVTVAVPLASGALVYVSVPFETTAGLAEKSDGLFVVTVKVTVCPDSSGGPAEMPVAQFGTLCGPASSFEVWSAPLVNDGASWTAVTTMVKWCGGEGAFPWWGVAPA